MLWACWSLEAQLRLVAMNSLASWGLSRVRLICSDVGGFFQGQPAGPLGERDMGVWGHC